MKQILSGMTMNSPNLGLKRRFNSRDDVRRQ